MTSKRSRLSKKEYDEVKDLSFHDLIDSAIKEMNLTVDKSKLRGIVMTWMLNGMHWYELYKNYDWTLVNTGLKKHDRYNRNS